jgi:hypothetical protein
MSYRITLTTTHFKDFDRASATFAKAERTLLEGEIVRLLEPTPNTWVVAFFNADDDSFIGCL